MPIKIRFAIPIIRPAGVLAIVLFSLCLPQTVFASSIIGWGYMAVDSAELAQKNHIAIAAGGNHSLALRSDGTIAGWGYNEFGQASPPDGNNFKAIAAGGSHSIGLKSDGSVVGWGYDGSGQADLPAGKDYTAIAAGGYHSLALRKDHSIAAVGDNYFHQVTPPAGYSFTAVAAGGYQSLALKLDGSIVAWGRDNCGQNTPPSGNNYIAIATGGDWQMGHSLALKQDGSIVEWGCQANPPEGNNYIAIAAGARHSLALNKDQSIVAWGSNDDGECNVPSPNTGFIAISAGDHFSLARKANGTIVAWGRNDYGQVSLPVRSNYSAIAGGYQYSLALRSDGSIVGWGENWLGKATPPSGKNYTAVAAGYDHSLALRSDGRSIGWGYNQYGKATPPLAYDYIAIAGGKHHSLGLRSDGTIVGWGYNDYGQTDPPDGNNYIGIAAGYDHSLALRSNGSIVGWGYNSDGRASPPSGNNYIAIAAGYEHSLALTSDGTIAGWGGPNYGGEATPPDGNNYIAIAGGCRYSLALRSDGTIVGWGYNDYGQASPPLGNNFVAIAAGVHGSHSLALRAVLTETSDANTISIETLSARQGILENVQVTGDFNGVADFNSFDVVMITTGPWAGKGFSRGICKATFESQYTGQWGGFLFSKPQEKRIYLKGSVTGEILATVDGYLTESVPNSNSYDQYQATWKIGRLGNTTTSVTVTLKGAISYESSSEFPATSLYILQSSFEGDVAGNYTGRPLSAVINHIRIDTPSNPYFGQGFSVISYTSKSGQGQGWAYNKVVSTGIVELQGLFDSPFFGVVSGTLDEKADPRALYARVDRIDLGSPPAADLKVVTWGPGRVSPGQTIDYIIEYRNDGLRAAENIVVGVEIPECLEYVSSSEGGIYLPAESPGEEVWFESGISPQTKGYKTIAVRVPWGLPGGTNLNITGFVGYTVPEIRDGFCVSKTDIFPGVPSPDIGDCAPEGTLLASFPETRKWEKQYPLSPLVNNNGDGTCTVTFRCRTWYTVQEEHRTCDLVSRVSSTCQSRLEWGYKSCSPWVTGEQQGYITEKTVTLDCDLICSINPEACPNFPKNTFSSQVTPARDPNRKLGPVGRVFAGERLTYRVEYENEGEGIAFGVYCTDTLDGDLNDVTLEIGPVNDVNTGEKIGKPGIYDPVTRTITWFVGQVDPNHGGYADFSVDVNNGAPLGTEIINFATVYFPSVPEATRTNSIVSIVTYTGDLDIDKDVDSVDLRKFTSYWLNSDCNYPDWCESADISKNGKVDFNDFALFAENWLEPWSGDLDVDRDVDLVDLRKFTSYWLNSDCNYPDWCEKADISKNSMVDFYDFALFAENWLKGTAP